MLPFPELSAEQRQAVTKALRGPDLVVLDASNGAELHAVQKAVIAALADRDVLAVAPTNSAAQELARTCGAEPGSVFSKFLHDLAQKSGAKPVSTLSTLLNELDRSFADSLKHHGMMLVQAALGGPTWSMRTVRLTPETTVILDSASLADTRQMARLLEHVERAGARLVVCGSHRMPALTLGGLYGELVARAKPEQLARFGEKTPNPVELVTSHSQSEAKEALLERWSQAALKRPKGHLIVTAANGLVHELNLAAQARRKEAGRLGLRWLTVRYKLNGKLVRERIYEGDRIVFTGRTDKEVVNGVFGTVKHIDLLTGRIKVALDQEKTKLFPWEFQPQQDHRVSLPELSLLPPPNRGLPPGVCRQHLPHSERRGGGQ